jgi:carbon storage regulator
MLVLTRKSQQSIMIGDDIEVSVLAVDAHTVRIGIRAPRRIPVFRNEIYTPPERPQPGADRSARAEVDGVLARLRRPAAAELPTRA